MNSNFYNNDLILQKPKQTNFALWISVFVVVSFLIFLFVKSVNCAPNDDTVPSDDTLNSVGNECRMSEWSVWRSCKTGECDPGKNKIRTRTVLGGTCNKPVKEQRYDQPTGVDCILNVWSEWKPCKINCPIGKKEYRTREIYQHPEGGMECGETIEYKN